MDSTEQSGFVLQGKRGEVFEDSMNLKLELKIQGKARPQMDALGICSVKHYRKMRTAPDRQFLVCGYSECVKHEQQISGVLEFPSGMAADAVRFGKFFATDFSALEVGAGVGVGVLPLLFINGFFASQRWALLMMTLVMAWCDEIFRKGGVIVCPAIQSAVVLPAEDGRLPRRSPECHHLFGVCFWGT
jgi:hypothetical protein